MQRPRGKLRISAPSWFGSRFFAKLLRGYREQYPEVELDISLSDAMVDWVADGLDIALRVTRATDAPKARRLGTIHFVLLASKAYLELRGRPRLPKRSSRTRTHSIRLRAAPLSYGQIELAL